MNNYTLEEYIKLIDDNILSFIPETDPACGVIARAMEYSLEGGGKRVRPVLTLEFCRISGCDPKKALPFAAGIEFIHTYSLIHDDLPCMDNDDFRRGKPSSHKKFGEATAVLAGDALLTHAFSAIASADLKPEQLAAAVGQAASYAGIGGMIGGQIVDMQGEETSLDIDSLFLMDKLKTSALIKCACALGCIAAENYDGIPCAVEFGEKLGLAFQIVDDILDFLEGEGGGDLVSGKSTYVSILGIEGAKAEADKYTGEALKALDTFPGDTEFLKSLAQKLLGRTA